LEVGFLIDTFGLPNPQLPPSHGTLAETQERHETHKKKPKKRKRKKVLLTQNPFFVL
jgi:hypothetical protein